MCVVPTPSDKREAKKNARIDGEIIKGFGCFMRKDFAQTPLPKKKIQKKEHTLQRNAPSGALPAKSTLRYTRYHILTIKKVKLSFLINEDISCQKFVFPRSKNFTSDVGVRTTPVVPTQNSPKNPEKVKHFYGQYMLPYGSLNAMIKDL